MAAIGTCCGSDIGSRKLVAEVGVWLAVKIRNRRLITRSLEANVRVACSKSTG